MKHIFCKHEWIRVGKLDHLRYDTDGVEVTTAMCLCKKCGKYKQKKFIGRIIGHLMG